MLVMGISGGPFKTHEDGSALISRFAFHDGSAVLLDSGEVVAGIEGERLNRIKHSNKFPIEAIRFCLECYGAKLQDVDYLAYYSEEACVDRALEAWNEHRALQNHRFVEYHDAKHLLQGLLSSEFDYDIPPEKLVFVSHHYAHALSAFLPSGFDESLILTLDAQGDNESGRVMIGKGSTLDLLASLPVSNSLGGFYVTIIRVMGFQQFDEYKAMGLAPYGDPARFRDVFKGFYDLLPDGEYALNWEEISKLSRAMKIRRPEEEFTREHMDVAAALQESLEEIVFHVLANYKESTGQRNLCFAGGIAHNCSLNGKILDSKMFDRVFVQPAAHDAGCAYGAALLVHANKSEVKVPTFDHLYWGSDIGDNNAVLEALTPWRDRISVLEVPDIFSRTAALIASGSVIGWVQGRSEFGPRALGNRSILADPRPAKNKEIINAMVKKREAFRPFAPSILEEYAEEFFEVDASNRDLAYMVFVVRVRPTKRGILGAVTHVDGTARIQTVSRRTNEKYWRLISAFNEITGIPVLLNTSFNNNAEPIVDSVEDAVVCFLTTKLNYLVVGNCLISKKSGPPGYLDMIPSLPRYAMICQTKKTDIKDQSVVVYECRNNFDSSLKIELSPEAFDILVRADGKATLAELTADLGNSRRLNANALNQELHDLWSRRVISLKPSNAAK